MGAIMAANSIPNADRIFSGQRLIIPCGVETGIPSIPQKPLGPPTTGQQPPGPPVFPTGVDCSTFRATSPLDGLNYGLNTFYWDGATGATGYRVNIYGIDEANGALVRSFDGRGTATSLVADITNETTGFGFRFAWEVQALFNGVVACISNRYVVPRGAPVGSAPATAVSGSSFTASWGCVTSFSYKVDYSNTPPGTTSVTVNYTGSGALPSGPTTGPVPPDPGTIFFGATGTGSASAGSITANPSSITLPLPGTLSC